jgi:hypothetical protein
MHKNIVGNQIRSHVRKHNETATNASSKSFAAINDFKGVNHTAAHFTN